MIGQILQQIGWVNLLWNKVEHLWFYAFQALTPDEARMQLDSLYLQLPDGKRRRDAFVELLAAQPDFEPEKLAKIRVLNQRTTEAAELRNALMHADFGVGIEAGVASLTVSVGFGKKPNKLSQKDLQAELAKLTATLRKLIVDVEMEMLPPPPTDLPPGFEYPTSARFVTFIEEVMTLQSGGGHARELP